MTIEETLASRGARYGDWMDQGEVSDQIISAMEKTAGWPKMPGWMRQTYRMIAEKMARAATGDIFYADNLHDIAGYATIGEERLHRAVAAQKQPELPLRAKIDDELRYAAFVDGGVLLPEDAAALLKSKYVPKYTAIPRAMCHRHGAYYPSDPTQPCPICVQERGEQLGLNAARPLPAELDPSDGA